MYTLVVSGIFEDFDELNSFEVLHGLKIFKDLQIFNSLEALSYFDVFLDVFGNINIFGGFVFK